MADGVNLMRGILSRLFGTSNEAKADQQPITNNPVAIPIPEGLDPDATRRVSGLLVTTDPAEAARQMAGKNATLFAFERSRAEAAGCVAYTWRAAGGADVCATCRARDGKRFLYAVEPEHGHAGVCSACPQGWCRCVAEPILPDE